MKYLNTQPCISSNARVFPSAVVIGDVSIGSRANIWFNATVRGDMAPVTIGKGTNIQDNAVVHTNTDLPTIIGDFVTVGHGAIIHAATVGDGALIGMGSIILDGAVIGKNAMVGAGCLVPPGKIVPEGMLAIGNPMRIVRPLSDAEIESNRENAMHYIRMMDEYDE